MGFPPGPIAPVLGNSFGRHLLTRAGPPDHADLRQDRSAALAGDSAFRTGAPRSMKMDSIVLPWRHDYDAENTIEATLHCGRDHRRPACRPRHPRKSAGALRPDGVRLHSNNQCNFSGHCVVLAIVRAAKRLSVQAGCRCSRDPAAPHPLCPCCKCAK